MALTLDKGACLLGLLSHELEGTIMGLEQGQWCILLAMLNCIVFMACMADWNNDPSTKNLFSMLSWAASMTFWLLRGVVPV